MGRVIDAIFKRQEKKGFCENPLCHLSKLHLPDGRDVARIRDGLGEREVQRHMVMKGKEMVFLCSICKAAVDMVDVKIIT